LCAPRWLYLYDIVLRSSSAIKTSNRSAGVALSDVRYLPLRRWHDDDDDQLNGQNRRTVRRSRLVYYYYGARGAGNQMTRRSFRKTFYSRFLMVWRYSPSVYSVSRSIRREIFFAFNTRVEFRFHMFGHCYTLHIKKNTINFGFKSSTSSRPSRMRSCNFFDEFLRTTRTRSLFNRRSRVDHRTQTD